MNSDRTDVHIRQKREPERRIQNAGEVPAYVPTEFPEGKTKAAEQISRPGIRKSSPGAKACAAHGRNNRTSQTKGRSLRAPGPEKQPPARTVCPRVAQDSPGSGRGPGVRTSGPLSLAEVTRFHPRRRASGFHSDTSSWDREAAFLRLSCEKELSHAFYIQLSII